MTETLAELTCKKKLCFVKRREALLAAADRMVNFPEKFPREMGVYWCREHKAFHITKLKTKSVIRY